MLINDIIKAVKSQFQNGITRKKQKKYIKTETCTYPQAYVTLRTKDKH